MNTYTTTDLVTLRQRELRAQAADHRRSIEARAAATQPEQPARAAITFRLRQVIGTLPSFRVNPVSMAGGAR
jgi:hypothetical protein